MRMDCETGETTRSRLSASGLRKSDKSPHHLVKQGLITVHDIVDDVRAADGPEVFAGAVDLRLLDLPQFKRGFRLTS